VTVSLQEGVAKGKGYGDISRLFMGQFGISYRNAMRITRTEGGRVRTITSQKAYDDGLKLGVKGLKKQWLATLDIKTRPQHGLLDGQIVNADENFKYGGLEAIGPRCFLSADLDINCRCTTIPVIDEKDQKDELRRDIASGKNGNWKNYSEWKQWKDEQLRSKGSSFATEQKKVLNQASDKKQAKLYRSVGIKTGDIMAFQQIKYNDAKAYAQMKDEYFIKSRLKSGVYGNIVNVNKQARHNYETHTLGKSYLLKGVDAQKLFNEYKGAGSVQKDKNGRRTNVEYVISDKNIGFASSKNSREKTRAFKIHHSKTGAHIVPLAEGAYYGKMG
jgi:SPP1 gp7 family putative phage head morphogenesis protein